MSSNQCNKLHSKLHFNFKKYLAVAAATSILLTSLSGCGTDKNVSTTADSDIDFSSYPIQTDVTLKYWCSTGVGDGGNVNVSDVPFVKELEQQTGIKVEYILASTDGAQKREQFNLMLASRDLPDIIEQNWFSVTGGPEQMLHDEYLIDLNDIIDQHSPNLKKYLSERPDIDKEVKTDSGVYYAFPFIREDDHIKVFNGPILRKDWLDDLNLTVPETIDEWYTVLKAFKESKNATIPLTVLPNFFSDIPAFIGAFGIKKGFFLDNGTVMFGEITEGYRQYLETVRKWYEEGLLDNNFNITDTNILDSNMTSGASGATVNAVGGGIGKWLGLMKDKEPGYDLVGAPYAVMNKGDTPKFGSADKTFGGIGNSITTNCKNPILAAKFLDYGYGDKGHMLFNFGIEGESYDMVDGYPKYSSLITENPEGLSIRQAMSMYMRSHSAGPFVQDPRYFEQYQSLPQQQSAIQTWIVEGDTSQMPNVSMTIEESKQYSKIMGDIGTYISEMYEKFIIGSESLDGYDDYVQRIKQMNIDEAIKIQQDAYDRYINR